MKEDEELVFEIPKVSKTCEKCKYGVAVGTYNTYCAKYNKKPDEVYFGGEECPLFAIAKRFLNK